MADHALLARSRSHSFQRAVADDAASTSNPAGMADPATLVPPEARSVSPRSGQQFPLPSMHQPGAPVHSGPVYAPSGPQHQASDTAEDGVVTIRESHYKVADFEKLLHAGSPVHTVVIKWPASLFPIIGELNTCPAFLQHVRRLKFEVGASKSAISSGLSSSPLRLPSFIPDQARDLADFLARNPTLATLDLSNLDFDDELLVRIADALAGNSTLKALHLDASTVQARGTVRSSYPTRLGRIGGGLAAVICKSAHLASLSASRQWIGAADAIDIAAAISSNTSLTSLALADNIIPAHGSEAIFDAVRKNRGNHLERLDLSGCEIDAGAARSLAALLKENNCLLQVSIGTVPDADCLAIIHAGLSRNQVLEELCFASMPEPSRQFKKIALKMMLHFHEQGTAAPAPSRSIAYKLNSASISFDGTSGKGKKSS